MTSVKRREHHDSGEYSDASQDIEQNNSANDGQQESDYDSAGSDSDHSDRDQNSQEVEQRRVDDDEDRSNPQYIPKRGTFYEHDDRTAASGEETANTTSETTSDKKETEAPPERRRPPRKSEIIDKWSHDKYNENEQMPKSREELVAIYGYDIRNEDAPPHARRNRRYGRGPNKYTRTWEDEDAYRRGAAPPPHRRPNAPPAAPAAPTPNDFPDLDTAHRSKKSGRQQRPRSKSQPASNTSSDSGSQLRRNASTKSPKGKPKQEAVKKTAPNKYTPKTQQAKEKMPPLENLTITATVYNNNQGQPQRKVNASVAQQKPVPTEQGKKKPQPQAQQPPQQNNTAPKPQPQAQPSPQQQPKQQSQNQQQQNQQQQPASGAEQRGSKRYSSLRQRPLAETYSPQQPPPQPALPAGPQNTQQQHRYVAEYQPASSQNTQTTQHQGSPVPQIHPQQMMHQVHRNPPVSQQQHGPSPPHQALPQHTQQQVRLGMLEQPQLVSHPHHQLHNIPQPHAIGQLQPTQGYAPPAMMPAQYMQIPRSLGSQTAAIEQGGNSAVFAGAMYAQPPPGPYPHQLYQHHNYATQAGGVTYYSPAEQEQAPRAQRRPTAAIPIVRPAHPPHPPHPPHTDRPANPTEKDNIDRIVENMFVRKPWPATHGTDSKEKSENRNSQEPQSKENSQPNSLTSSSISTDSKPSENKEEKIEEQKEEEKKVDVKETAMTESTDMSAQAESISADA